MKKLILKDYVASSNTAFWEDYEQKENYILHKEKEPDEYMIIGDPKNIYFGELIKYNKKGDIEIFNKSDFIFESYTKIDSNKMIFDILKELDKLEIDDLENKVLLSELYITIIKKAIEVHIMKFANQIKHGDEEHQNWLLKEAKKYTENL